MSPSLGAMQAEELEQLERELAAARRTLVALWTALSTIRDNNPELKGYVEAVQADLVLEFLKATGTPA